jgi:adenosylcobinamide-GDP ribazoletransferase
MKDSRIGAFGALGLGIAVLLKWQCIAIGPGFNFAGIRGVMAALWCGHALSRGMVCAVPKMLDYLDSAGSKSKPMVEPLSRLRLGVAAILALAPAIVCGEFGLISFGRLGIAFGIMVFSTLALTAGFSKRLGGYTGDCLGAIQQITELFFYLVIFAAW